MIRDLCQLLWQITELHVTSVRVHCNLQILPMENIHGREVVEAGNLCERKNGRGVDSNRNWPVHWGVQEKDYDPSEEFPGSKPFRFVTRTILISQ